MAYGGVFKDFYTHEATRVQVFRIPPSSELLKRHEVCVSAWKDRKCATTGAPLFSWKTLKALENVDKLIKAGQLSGERLYGECACSRAAT
jgi:hypothetical protein